jgi:hypothetical protein
MHEACLKSVITIIMKVLLDNPQKNSTHKGILVKICKDVQKPQLPPGPGILLLEVWLQLKNVLVATANCTRFAFLRTFAIESCLVQPLLSKHHFDPFGLIQVFRMTGRVNHGFIQNF